MYSVRRNNGKNENLTNLEQHFQYLLHSYNFNFYNANGRFCMQLFDKAVFSKDGVDGEAEFQGDSIAQVISQAINWMDEQMDSESSD